MMKLLRNSVDKFQKKNCLWNYIKIVKRMKQNFKKFYQKIIFSLYVMIKIKKKILTIKSSKDLTIKWKRFMKKKILALKISQLFKFYHKK